MTALSIQTMQQEKLALAPSVFNQHKTAQKLTTESLHPKVEALSFHGLKFNYPYFGIYGKDDYAKLQSKLITNRLITIAGICVILIQIKFTPC